MFLFFKKDLLRQNLSEIFQAEKIPPIQAPASRALPPLLKKARALATQRTHHSYAALFLRQGKLLADYTDDYEYSEDVIRYYPTYQALTDEELRGYFCWRTKIRKGSFPLAPVPYILLLIYEIINNIGIASPLEGYALLDRLEAEYGDASQFISRAIPGWLRDYAVYYNLDVNLLSDLPDIAQNNNIAIIHNIQNEPAEKVIAAVKEIAPKWTARSKFYASHAPQFDEVLHGVLMRMHKHYAKGCKHGLTAQIFSPPGTQWTTLFNGAIFCDPLKRKDYEYRINDQYSYRLTNGYWYVDKMEVTSRSVGILADLMKTIDSLMRKALNFGHPIKTEISTKWLLAAIQDQIQSLLAKNTQSPGRPAPIDLSSLDKIRQDAAITKEKLNLPEAEEEQSAPSKPPVQEAEMEDTTGLAPQERKLLQTLINGQDTSWLSQEGLILSVLIDSINDKLYDTFGDTVIDGTAALIPDYIPKLKELLRL